MATNFDSFRIDIKDHFGILLIRDLPHAPNTTFSRSISTPDQFILDTFKVELLPDWKNKADLRIVYDRLDYQQQVWIYSDFSGQLLFVGLIIDKPSDMDNKGIAGEDIRWLFTRRFLGHFEFITGTVQSSLEYLSKFWQPIYLDKLDSLTGWNVFAGTWAIIDNKLTATGGGTPDGIADNTIFSDTYNQSPPFRWQFTVSSSGLTETRIMSISCIPDGAGAAFNLDMIHSPGEDGHLFRLSYNGLTETREIFQTDHRAPVDELLTIDIWVLENTIEVWLNGIQIILVDSTHPGLSGLQTVALQGENGQTFEKAIRWEKQEYMSLDLTSTKSAALTDQQFQQDTHQRAFSYYFDSFRLESRPDYLSSPPHQLTVGDFVGEDKSNYIIFERGKNLTNLTAPSTAQRLSTWVDLFGQGQFTNQTLASSCDFDAIGTYGVIQEQINDSRITVPGTARQKADSILETRSSGVVSMTATITETTTTRGRWDAGDIIQIIDKAQSIDRPARVLKIQYIEATLERHVTFDRLPYDRADELSKQADNIADIYRLNKGDTATQTFAITRQTLWIGASDEEIRYINDPSASSGPTITYWQKISGGAGIGAYGNALQFVNIDDSFAILQFYSSGIKIFCRTDSNMAFIRVFIDNVLQATVDQNTGGRVDRVLIYSNTGLDSGFHILKLQRGGPDPNLNLFMNVDAIRLGGWYTDIVIEFRSIDDAVIDWKISNQVTPVKVIIDNVDRTAALGGGGGFLGDQNINALQFLSKPGAHSVEFVNDDHTLEDLYLEAKITVTGLV
jgi:hypothetical protein